MIPLNPDNVRRQRACPIHRRRSMPIIGILRKLDYGYNTPQDIALIKSDVRDNCKAQKRGNRACFICGKGKKDDEGLIPVNYRFGTATDRKLNGVYVRNTWIAGMSFDVLKRKVWYGTIKCYCIRFLLLKKESICQKSVEIKREESCVVVKANGQMESICFDIRMPQRCGRRKRRRCKPAVELKIA